jgi:EmrB/QacA subfamily drug resistance transporter
MTTAVRAPSLSYSEPAGRWVLLATVLGSGMAFLDATVVNVALPAIGRDLGANLAGLQWTVNAYTLTLASFILLGGSAGDRFGRRRVFVVGAVWFAVASLLCGLAPSVETLVAARALQGVGGALLTPGSLAILQSSFRPDDRGRAIGAWSGLAGIAGALGPFLGGWLVDAVSWRLVFLINVPIAVAVVWVSARHVPETRDPMAPHRFDVPGALLCAAALAGVTYGLVAWGEQGPGRISTWLPLLLGSVAAALFVYVERASRQPMLPLALFGSRLFRAVNSVTFLVYAALGGVFFMLVITLQVVAGFDPILAGAALLPVTGLMLLLSARAGDLAQRIGPRGPMTVGPLVSAAGVVLLTRVGPGATYVGDVLPGVVLFGLGLSATVAPLTATVLAAAPQRHTGVASGVNNAVARSGGLLAVAALPALVGLSANAYADPAVLEPAYSRSMLVCAALLAAGGLLSWLTVRTPGVRPPEEPPERELPRSPCRVHCAVAGTPLTPDLVEGGGSTAS